MVCNLTIESIYVKLKNSKIYIRKHKEDPVFGWMFANGTNSISNTNTDTTWIFYGPFLRAHLLSHRVSHMIRQSTMTQEDIFS